MAKYIDETINKQLGLDDMEVEEQYVSAPNDVIRKYGIIQEIMQQSADRDVVLEARRKLQDNCMPEETLEFQCMGDLDYKVGYGVVVDIPQVDSLQRFMYVRSVTNTWHSNGEFTSTLSLTKSRVMDTQEWQSEMDSEEEYGSGVVNSELWNKIYNLLKQQLGKPYVYGATGADSFDCSGLVMYCYNQFESDIGFHIGRTTYQQCKQGFEVNKDDKSEWQEGDLIFFTGSSTPPSHVAVYIGDNKMIHSPHTGDVVKIVDVTRTDIYAVRRVLPEISGGFTSDTFDNDNTNIPNALLNDIKQNVENMVAGVIPNIPNFKDSLLKASKKYYIDKYLILAIITCESEGRMLPPNQYNCAGLMQVTDILAQEFGYDRFSIDGNINIGCSYYNQLWDKFGNRPVVLTAYNGGAYCDTIKALKALGKDWRDVSLNDIYKHATNSESREFAGRILYAYKLLKEKKALG
ncbi:NlpC/P60 family protein [Clostridium butyricum]|uniref:NlpC/P60 family protein n=2 Tax=Clostridium butyricum TaxID=1492 RepID=UPI0030C85BF1